MDSNVSRRNSKLMYYGRAFKNALTKEGSHKKDATVTSPIEGNSDYHWTGNGDKSNKRMETLENGNDYSSSAIRSVEYHPQNQQAVVQYEGSDKKYTFPMNGSEFDDLQRADSKGQWFAYNARRYV